MDVENQRNQEKKNQKTRVKVAIRVRPMIPKEIANNENSCVQFHGNNEIILAHDKNYKFDYVFPENSKQNQIYDECVQDLVHSCFDGYNAAILAYGQTGSGKTFTMGTANQHNFAHPSDQGIIPRVIGEIFHQVKQRQKKAEFIVKASFLQIYNEQIIDLLSSGSNGKNSKIKDHVISIREEKDGSVSICNVTEEEVTTAEQMLDLLERGGYHRTTSSTLMNDASSRSHAIFTIFIEQHLIEDLYKAEKKKQKYDVEDGFMTAKFFFVDLAGSERAKKTGATGATLKEGININLGLLQLGNVISALATIEKKQSQFITYRNSKLTRILQDCLGGNSNTYMIACVSPAQSNFQESLNTLKYASKAMNIKNKPIKNRDPQSALISQLRQRIYELEVQNRKLKGLLGDKGVNVEEEITKSSDIMYEQVKKLKKMYVTLEKKFQEATAEMKEQKRLKSGLQIEVYDLKRDRDIAFLKLESVKEKYPDIVIHSLEDDPDSSLKMGVLNELTEKVQQLNSQLTDKQNLYNALQNEFSQIQSSSKKDQKLLIAKNNQIYNLKKENEKLKKQIKNLKQSMDSPHQTYYSNENEVSTILTEAINSCIEEDEDHDDIDEDYFHDDLPPELQEHEAKFQKNHTQAESELDLVDRKILEKENDLEAMSANQIKLEYHLISEMKQEYHHKIVMLEKEKSSLMKQRDETVGLNQKNRFMNKIDNLENQLKDFRKKAKEQKNLEKLVGNQSSKIKDLANEIKKFKLQKIELGRKIKQDKDVFHKYKTKKLKQIFAARKQNVKKDRQLKKLTLENNRKVQSYRKKEQQLKRAKRVNQALKNLIKSKANKSGMKESLTSSMIMSVSYDRSEKQIDDHVVQCIEKIMGEIDQEKILQKYQKKIKEMEEQIKQLLAQDSSMKIKFERLKMKDEDQLTEEQANIKEQLALNLNDLKERLSNAEDNLNFCHKKYNDLIGTNSNIFDLDTEILYQKAYENVQGLRIFVRSLFMTIRSVLHDNYCLYETKQQNQIEIGQKNGKIDELKQKIIVMNTEHQSALERLREDMLVRYYSNLEDQEASTTPVKRMEERQKKNFERRIVDLTKTNRQLSNQVEMWRRKCNVVQEKYQNIRGLLSKDKGIGRPTRQQQSGKQKQKQVVNTKSSIIEEINEISDELDRMDKMRKVVSLSQSTLEKRQQKKQRHEYTVNKWECLGKIEAHSSAVHSIAIHANMLISTSTKSLKIWDLQTSKIISDLSGSHLTGLVKYVMVDPSRNIMLTACQKVVTIWDLITLNVQCTLKAHKDEVRTMHIIDNLLFSGGKGLANSGSLLTWDLRHLDPNKPQEQKQRNQDIFTFASHRNTLYYGTRNHHVRRMDLRSMEILAPFEPPHMDTVTGLALIGNNLISGSKDKNLRLWNLEQSISNLKNTTHAFNDWVTTLQSDNNLSIFYSGSKDGQVKVGSVRNDKIQFVGGILAHTQSVNAISPLEDSNAIVTASADKTIKIWRPSNQTEEKIEKQYLG